MLDAKAIALVTVHSSGRTKDGWIEHILFAQQLLLKKINGNKKINPKYVISPSPLSLTSM
jgi:hypothetical protein